ncbi:hypothetical protein OF83DRAFT_1149074 [Amylostereum chailletii]|nr:hypothetical protein OF83DRAFT_1149074 [Amylostereum chailletii]
MSDCVSLRSETPSFWQNYGPEFAGAGFGTFTNIFGNSVVSVAVKFLPGSQAARADQYMRDVMDLLENYHELLSDDDLYEIRRKWEQGLRAKRDVEKKYKGSWMGVRAWSDCSEYKQAAKQAFKITSTHSDRARTKKYFSRVSGSKPQSSTGIKPWQDDNGPSSDANTQVPEDGGDLVMTTYTSPRTGDPGRVDVFSSPVGNGENIAAIAVRPLESTASSSLAARVSVSDITPDLNVVTSRPKETQTIWMPSDTSSDTRSIDYALETLGIAP